MGKKILIGGQPLHKCSIDDIISETLKATWEKYDLGPCGDFFRNRNLTEAFGDLESDTLLNLAGRYHETRKVYLETFSEKFDAIRFGESVGFGLRHGIIEWVRGGGRTLRLVHRELLFELVGPERQRRAIQVRGLQGEDAVAAEKLWGRELKRRERARLQAEEEA